MIRGEQYLLQMMTQRQVRLARVGKPDPRQYRKILEQLTIAGQSVMNKRSIVVARGESVGKQI